MTRARMMSASAGDAKADEIMRKVRKDVVSSIMTSAPRKSVVKWIGGKDTATGAQK